MGVTQIILKTEVFYESNIFASLQVIEVLHIYFTSIFPFFSGGIMPILANKAKLKSAVSYFLVLEVIQKLFLTKLSHLTSLLVTKVIIIAHSNISS